MMMEEKKIFWKHWTGVLLLVMIAILVLILLLNLGEVINIVQGKFLAWKERRQIEETQKPYKNDKYGGSTPEETFDLFVAALKKEDINLASKYFIVSKQESWWRALGEYKTTGLLSDFIVELEHTRSIWKKNVAENNEDVVEFHFSTRIEKVSETDLNGQKMTIPIREYSSITRFEKYPSGIWKISIL